jgi:hypothetical protein
VFALCAGAVFNLSMLTEMVLAHHCSCQRLCVLGQDVLGVLDNAGDHAAAEMSAYLDFNINTQVSRFQ